MKLINVNVGYGDCFLFLKDCDNMFLNDFGTLSYNRMENHFGTFQNLCSAAYNLLSRVQNLNGLISHYDRDHISGFRSLWRQGLIFKNLYLCPFIVRNSVSENIALEVYLFAHSFLGNSSIYYRASQAYFDAFLEMQMGANNIQFVYRDDIITILNEEFKVLWPPKNFKLHLENDPSVGTYESMRRILKNIEKSSEYDKMKTKIEEFIKQEDKMNDNDKKHFRKLLDEMRQMFVKYGIKSYQIKNIKITNNLFSIVYHSKENTEDKNIIMMGDVDKCVIDHVLINDFYNRYKLLKAPHHGTDSHYSRNLPSSKYTMISIGRRCRFQPISRRYSCTKYGVKICSRGDTFCQTLTSQNHCSNSACRNDPYGYINI